MTPEENLKKVINGLECCMSGQPDGLGCSRVPCPYNQFEDCEGILHRDALALLKEQEPIEPVKVNRYMETDENGDWFSPETYDCGYCGVELHGKANYCHLCGRAVKWGD